MENKQLPSLQHCLSLLLPLGCAQVGQGMLQSSSSEPPCPLCEAGSDTRASGVGYFGIWSVPVSSKVVRNCCN